MRLAVTLARRGLGRVWPNPAVGCVIVKAGHIVGRGWTQPGGRPHAETEALARAGARAVDATAYVSLEPCAHHGQTPPCCEALVAAKIRRVVAAVEDPDPRVGGRGLAMLRDAGIGVTVGVLADAAAEVNRGFFLRVREHRPMITWKVAASLDGRLATAAGESKWITGSGARAIGHRLRAGHDAILVGSQTALIDDPALTCRLPGLEDASPVRVIADRRLRLPPTAAVVRGARDHPTWVITDAQHDAARANALRTQGVEILAREPADPAAAPVMDIARLLAARGITRLLIEGGGTLAASFIDADLVDAVAWFQAPKLIGADGIPAVGALNVADVARAPGFTRIGGETVADDTVSYYLRRMTDRAGTAG